MLILGKRGPKWYSGTKKLRESRYFMIFSVPVKTVSNLPQVPRKM